jgi:hypothetical protein
MMRGPEIFVLVIVIVVFFLVALVAQAIAGAAHDAALIDARQAHCQGAGPCW